MKKRLANYVYKRRLLKLADFLQELPRKRFDYGHWVGDNWGGAADLSCGTTACAWGWATTIPLFRKLGLRLKYRTKNSIAAYVGMIEVPKKFDTPSAAASRILDLAYNEYLKLFVPGHDKTLSYHATPKQVAKHIRNFVASKYPKKPKRVLTRHAYA